jgi:hypothetical protein
LRNSFDRSLATAAFNCAVRIDAMPITAASFQRDHGLAPGADQDH